MPFADSLRAEATEAAVVTSDEIPPHQRRPEQTIRPSDISQAFAPVPGTQGLIHDLSFQASSGLRRSSQTALSQGTPT